MALRSILRRVRSSNGTADILRNAIEVAARCNTSSVRVFTEIASPAEVKSVQASLPLAGAIVAVSECLDSVGFTTTYGLRSKLLHRSPKKDHPVVRILRQHGAQVVGKLRTVTPLGLEEGINFDEIPAASAVRAGACNVALVSSVFSAAGLVSATQGACAFKPTKESLPSASSTMTLSSAAAADTQEGQQGLSRFPTSLAFVGSDIDDLFRVWSAISNGTVDVESGNGIGGVLDGSPLIVGIPENWMRGVVKQQKFARQLAAQCGRVVKIQPLEMPGTLEEAYGATNVITTRNLAALLNTETFELSELPQKAVAAAYNGKNVTEEQFAAAQERIAGIRETLASQFQEVDVIACPLLCDPYQSGNLRTGSLMRPFSISGHPMASFDAGEMLGPIQVIGEMGRDTGLLEDAETLRVACASGGRKKQAAVVDEDASTFAK